MSNSFSAPMRVGAVVLGVVALIVVGLVVAYGPGEGRWLQGALSAGPAGSASPTAAESESSAAVEEEPAGGSSPSPSTAAQIKARNIADAKARLVEYYATVAEVANGGYEDWRHSLRSFWGTPGAWNAVTQVYERNRENEIRTEGAARIVSMKPINYEPDDAGFNEITIEVCVDFEEVKTFDREDSVIPRDASVPTRYMFTYGLRDQGDGNEWALIEEEPNLEQPC